MPGTFKILIFAVAGVAFSLINTFAQFTGIGNDQRYQSTFKVTELPNIPPTENDMSDRCQIGYSLIDSLSKGSKCNYLKDYIKYSPLDTLRSYASVFYAVMDYSPALFSSYVLTADKNINQEKPYITLPDCFYSSVQEVILQDRIEQFRKDFAYLFAAQYIFKVQIDSVIVGNDTSSMFPLEWVNASCSIIEIIKGSKLPANCKKVGDKPFETPISNVSTDCVNFGYIKNTPTGTGFSSSSSPMGNIKTVRKGEFYYLFLNLKPDQNNNDIVTPETRFEKTGGLFQLSNGIIYDPSNFWGLGNGVPEVQFRDNLSRKIDTILSWSDHRIINGILDIDLPEQSELYITPNPITSDILNINFTISSSSNISFTVTDIHGRKIIETKQNYYMPGNHKNTIYLPDISSGIYLVTLHNGLSIVSSPFIKY